MVTFGLLDFKEVTCLACPISNLEQPLGCSSNLYLSSLSESSSFVYCICNPYNKKRLGLGPTLFLLTIRGLL